MTFFVIGAHCAGKTSILKLLASEGTIAGRGDEIGKRLYYERRFAPAAQDQAFEEDVATREVARDREYVEVAGIWGIETWHPGNLAYAAVRNPAAIPALVALARASPLLSNCRGIWLRVASETIKRRTVTFAHDREWAAEFYSRIDGHLGACVSLLGLADRTVSISAEGSLDEVARSVRARVDEWRCEEATSVTTTAR